MTELWNNEEYLNDNALTVNISRLRADLKILVWKMLLRQERDRDIFLYEVRKIY